MADDRVLTLPVTGTRTGLYVVVGGTLISQIGDSVTSLALVLDAAARDSAVLIAAVFLSEMIPPILLARPLGRLVDRRNARNVWIVALLLQAATLTAAALAPLLGLKVALFAVSATIGVLSGSSSFKLLPRIAGASRLARANSLMTVAASTASIIGPGLCGLLYEFGGSTPLLLVDAATFLLLAVAVAVVVQPDRRDRLTSPSEVEIVPRKGLKLFTGDPVMRPITLIIACVIFGTSLEGLAGVFYLREIVDGNGFSYGLILSCWAVGSLIGAVLSGWSRLSLGHVQRLLAGAALIATGLLITGLVPVVGVIWFAYVAGGLGNGIFNASLRNVIHARVPHEHHGQAWATFVALSRACIVVGYLIGSITAQDHGREAVIASGIVPLVAVTVGTVLIRASLRRSPR